MSSKLKSPTSCWRNLQGKPMNVSSIEMYIYNDTFVAKIQQEFRKMRCHYGKRKWRT